MRTSVSIQFRFWVFISGKQISAVRLGRGVDGELAELFTVGFFFPEPRRCEQRSGAEAVSGATELMFALLEMWKVILSFFFN